MIDNYSKPLSIFKDFCSFILWSDYCHLSISWWIRLLPEGGNVNELRRSRNLLDFITIL